MVQQVGLVSWVEWLQKTKFLLPAVPNAQRKPNGLNLNFHSLQPHDSWLLFCIQTWSWNEFFSVCLSVHVFVSLFVCFFYICLFWFVFCLSLCQFVSSILHTLYWGFVFTMLSMFWWQYVAVYIIWKMYSFAYAYSILC